MNSIRKIIARSVVLLAVATFAGEAIACPNCKEAVASQDGDSMRLANGYSWSILLMIGTPFTLLGTGVLLVARAARRGAFPEF